MAQVRVPKSVKKQIAADEEVIGKLSTYADYYATNKRLLFFKRSEAWVAIFGLWGFLAQKKYGGNIEYSKISDITLKKHRPKGQVIAGLILGIPLLILGIVFISMPEGAPFGATFIVLAIILIMVLSILRQPYYQIESPDLSDKDMKKWRIHRPRMRGERVDQFIEIIKERVGK
jgi:hypothetical protein